MNMSLSLFRTVDRRPRFPPFLFPAGLFLFRFFVVPLFFFLFLEDLFFLLPPPKLP